MELQSQVRGRQGTGFQALKALPPPGASGLWSMSKVCWTRACREPRCRPTPAMPRWLFQSEFPLTLIPTPAFAIAGGPSTERKRGGRTDGRQGANHLQRGTRLLEFKMSPGFKSQWIQIPFLSGGWEGSICHSNSTITGEIVYYCQDCWLVPQPHIGSCP